MARSGKMSHLLVEHNLRAASKEYALLELRSLCRWSNLFSSKLFQFVFGLGMMTGQFLVLEVIPDFFVRIPIW